MLLNIQFLIRRTEFLLHPFTWMIILLLLAVFTYSQRKRKRYLTWALVVGVFFSNTFIVDEFTRVWEMDVTPVWEIDPNVKTAIVLGGGVYYDTETDVVTYGGNADRYLGVLRPYHEDKIQKILVSGGGANYLAPDVKESEMLKRLYLLCDIPSEDILVEEKSLNTYQNALYSKPILEELGEDEYLLITSALHMRRAVACFEKQGISVIAHPVMKSVGKRRYEIDHLLVPRVMNFHKWMVLIHEWVGYATYKLRGYV
jgi:uncharacterized SAM-binding protein YcdF (DUF218 family)